MITCPCCSNILLRHLNSHKITWFCLNCRQEMPLINSNKQHRINNAKKMVCQKVKN